MHKSPKKRFKPKQRKGKMSPRKLERQTLYAFGRKPSEKETRQFCR